MASLTHDDRRAATLGAAETHLPMATRGLVLDGRYELRHVLGEGGMGQVWEAEHLGLSRIVAVKLVDPRHRFLHARLLREARVLASLRHPAIVEVFDVGASPVGPFIAMERLDATPLDELIARGPLGVHRTIELFLPVLDGLKLAHDRGVVHRDLKPSNVLIVGGDDPGAETASAKLLDFGIAVTGGDARLTQSGMILGTPAYMAPEQIQSAVVDGRADVWGAAVTMLEAITGRLAFDAEDPTAIMAKVLTEAVERPTHVAALDDELWAIFEHALQKEPAARLGSARALHDALQGWRCSRGREEDREPAHAWSPPRALRVPETRAPETRSHETRSHETMDQLIRARLGDA